mmetsp:Transcript_16916/g.28645  ORF Transcript_16916/g.28645 Transcript_16916/m.28645 type:complete len:96 (+) Transcript_16916:2052-2339(+)
MQMFKATPDNLSLRNILLNCAHNFTKGFSEGQMLELRDQMLAKEIALDAGGAHQLNKVQRYKMLRILFSSGVISQEEKMDLLQKEKALNYSDIDD